jgi:hypothetical protein
VLQARKGRNETVAVTVVVTVVVMVKPVHEHVVVARRVFPIDHDTDPEACPSRISHGTRIQTALSQPKSVRDLAFELCKCLTRVASLQWANLCKLYVSKHHAHDTADIVGVAICSA